MSPLFALARENKPLYFCMLSEFIHALQMTLISAGKLTIYKWCRKPKLNFSINQFYLCDAETFTDAVKQAQTLIR